MTYEQVKYVDVGGCLRQVEDCQVQAVPTFNATDAALDARDLVWGPTGMTYSLRPFAQRSASCIRGKAKANQLSCFEQSSNAEPLQSNGVGHQAIHAYIAFPAKSIVSEASPD